LNSPIQFYGDDFGSDVLLEIVPTTLAGVVALVTYLDEVNKKDPWKFEDNYATPLIGTLATAFNRPANRALHAHRSNAAHRSHA
jgi:hypothetical protein